MVLVPEGQARTYKYILSRSSRGISVRRLRGIVIDGGVSWRWRWYR